jgi:hypothetical protein
MSRFVGKSAVGPLGDQHEHREACADESSRMIGRASVKILILEGDSDSQESLQIAPDNASSVSRYTYNHILYCISYSISYSQCPSPTQQ